MKATVSMRWVSCFLLLWTCAGSSALPWCPENCTCDTVRMTCENVIPRAVPKYVNEITLSLFNSSFLSPKIFCDVSWDGVIKLSIRETGSSDFYFNNYMFMCLNQIQVLKLHTTTHLIATNNAFYGLNKVTVLDFSGCARLRTRELVILLSVKTNVANLKKLILSNTGKILEGTELSQDLIDVLADKPIAEIDLTNTLLYAYNPDLDGICDTLKTLNLSNSLMPSKSHLLLNKECRSLRNLDLNALTISHNIPHNVSCIDNVLHLPSRKFQLFQHLNTLDFSRITFHAESLYFINCSVFGLSVGLNWKEIHLSGYNIPALDVKVDLLLDQLKYIDLSDNKIETIGPNLFSSFQYLNKLDLSKNKLSQTSLFDETFSDLFQNNSRLEEISLNDNGLPYLPLKTFASNLCLKRIDISSNLIQQITFNVSRLINLDILDMRNNSINRLDESSRESLDTLYEIHQHRKNHIKQTKASTVLVDLRSNPFSCECDSLRFVKWFEDSPIFAATRHQYHCKSEGQEIEMNSKAVEAAEDDCERPKRKLRKLLISSVIPSTTASLLALVIICVVKRYRKKKFYQRLEDQVGLLHDDKIGFRFPVFVSYSSDDSEFVIPNVLNPLKDHLQRIAGTDRDLVCVGDRHFRLGRSIFSEIITCLQDCAMVVVVMSKNYCKSDYCNLEIEQSRLMRKPIIIIMKEEVDEGEMNAVTKEIFRHFTRIGFIFEDGQVKLQRDWEDVCLSIIQLL